MNLLPNIKALFNRMPTTYWIDTTNICNLKCVMCPQSKGLARPKGSMRIDQFVKIIDQVCDNHPLIKLYMSGEPLLNQDIFQMIEYAHERGCSTMIHTNATLLTEEMSKRFLSSPLTFLSFSFDGCTSEIYEKLRPPAKFEEVKANIERFLELRSTTAIKGPHTTVEIIRMKDTQQYISNFVEHWEASGCDMVRIQPCMTWLDYVPDLKVESPPNFGYKPCILPFKSSCILVDGTVVPCCEDVNGKMPLGNIAENSFKEIWFGKKYDDLRFKLIEGITEKGSICNRCHNIYSRTKKERLVMILSDLLGVWKFLRITKRIYNNRHNK